MPPNDMDVAPVATDLSLLRCDEVVPALLADDAAVEATAPSSTDFQVIIGNPRHPMLARGAFARAPERALRGGTAKVYHDAAAGAVVKDIRGVGVAGELDTPGTVFAEAVMTATVLGTSGAVAVRLSGAHATLVTPYAGRTVQDALNLASAGLRVRSCAQSLTPAARREAAAQVFAGFAARIFAAYQALHTRGIAQSDGKLTNACVASPTDPSCPVELIDFGQAFPVTANAQRAFAAAVAAAAGVPDAVKRATLAAVRHHRENGLDLVTLRWYHGPTGVGVVKDSDRTTTNLLAWLFGLADEEPPVDPAIPVTCEPTPRATRFGTDAHVAARKAFWCLAGEVLSVAGFLADAWRVALGMRSGKAAWEDVRASCEAWLRPLVRDALAGLPRWPGCGRDALATGEGDVALHAAGGGRGVKRPSPDVEVLGEPTGKRRRGADDGDARRSREWMQE